MSLDILSIDHHKVNETYQITKNTIYGSYGTKQENINHLLVFNLPTNHHKIKIFFSVDDNFSTSYELKKNVDEENNTLMILILREITFHDGYMRPNHIIQSINVSSLNREIYLENFNGTYNLKFIEEFNENSTIENDVMGISYKKEHI